ncbi:hypothetical protein IMSAGC021_00408 [Muribaculaceae bacterium]|nr:hypothetical protein IMSAGC021_00408 [Muribaculaceae bacterium]
MLLIDYNLETDITAKCVGYSRITGHDNRSLVSNITIKNAESRYCITGIQSKILYCLAQIGVRADHIDFIVHRVGSSHHVSCRKLAGKLTHGIGRAAAVFIRNKNIGHDLINRHCRQSIEDADSATEHYRDHKPVPITAAQPDIITKI